MEEPENKSIACYFGIQIVNSVPKLKVKNSLLMKVEEITVQEKVNHLLHDVKVQPPLLPPTSPIFLKI